MNSKGNKFIAFVKEYKELVATIAFFVGGVLWVFGYFATKEEFRVLREATSDHNKQLNCLLKNHVKLLAGRHTLKVSYDDLMAVQEEIRKQTASGLQFSENDIKKTVKLEHQRDELKDNIASAEKDISEASAVITYRECEK
jgi:hypothetical protein